jgi:hypothetical protein
MQIPVDSAPAVQQDLSARRETRETAVAPQNPAAGQSRGGHDLFFMVQDNGHAGNIFRI